MSAAGAGRTDGPAHRRRRGAPTIALLLGCCAALLLGTAKADEPLRHVAGGVGGRIVPFEILIDEQASGLPRPYRAVITEDAAWRSLWSRVYADLDPPPAMKPVDFERHMVVVVAAGTQPTGGHGLGIDQIRIVGDRLEVRYHRTCPAPGMFSTMMLSQPVQAVRIEKTAATPVFLDMTQGDCR